MTIVVLLSDPKEFSGGHFEAKLLGKTTKVQLNAGDAVGFPAKHLYHRVTKISRGLRRSLVFWASSNPAPVVSKARKLPASKVAEARAAIQAFEATTESEASEPIRKRKKIEST